MEKEVHIAGILVQVLPEQRRRAAKELARLPRTEVHGDGAAKAGSKLVVVCECDSGDQLLALAGRIREIPGVLNVALVYQHVENAKAMEEEVDLDEVDTPGVH